MEWPIQDNLKLYVLCFWVFNIICRCAAIVHKFTTHDLCFWINHASDIKKKRKICWTGLEDLISSRIFLASCSVNDALSHVMPSFVLRGCALSLEFYVLWFVLVRHFRMDIYSKVKPSLSWQVWTIKIWLKCVSGNIKRL